MEKRSVSVEVAPSAEEDQVFGERSASALLEENDRLRSALLAAEREIGELAEELEEKAMALASSRNPSAEETNAAPTAAGEAAPAPAASTSNEAAPAAAPRGPTSSPVSSLIRSALTQGATQSRMRIALLEEEIGRQTERHAAQIAEIEGHFIAKLAQVAGGGEKAVLQVLEARIVELEQERAEPPLLAEARATIARLQAELEELRGENRFLSSEVDRWATLAQSQT